MKTQTRKLLLVSVLILLAIGGSAWWQAARSAAGEQRKVLCYQDSMHPWIKSDKPGKCTICAMDLTPIYEGKAGFGTAQDMVVLSAQSVTALNVQTEEVARGPLYRTLRAAGTLEADNTRKTVIGAPAPGRIDAVAVASVGVPVERGQVLATFYSPDLTFQTRRYIFRDRINTREEMTARDTAAGSSRHAPHGTEATSSHPVPSSQQADPFYNDLLSPQSGTIVERNVYDGQYVAEGDRLFVIVDLSVLWFRFDVYEQQLPWLAGGQAVEVTVPAAPGRVFKGAIALIEPTMVDTTRTTKVRVEVKNPLVGEGAHAQRLLRLGLYAEARVRAVVPEVLVVPRSAILFPGGQAYAYLDKGNGTYEMRQVELGRQGDAHWEVLSGLEEGERVVTSGNVLIDAQAQFVQGLRPVATEPGAAHAMADATCGAFTPEQQRVMIDFLAVADGISGALAADNLDALKPHTGRLPAVVAALATALESEPNWAEELRRIEAHSQWPEVTDLADARKVFLPFATNVVELVEKVRLQEEAFASLKVFVCSMAPKPGLWFQAKGPLRNPYWGAKMLTCGEEVKPKGRARSRAVQPTGTPATHVVRPMVSGSDPHACCEAEPGPGASSCLAGASLRTTPASHLSAPAGTPTAETPTVANGSHRSRRADDPVAESMRQRLARPQATARKPEAAAVPASAIVSEPDPYAVKVATRNPAGIAQVSITNTAREVPLPTARYSVHPGARASTTNHLRGVANYDTAAGAVRLRLSASAAGASAPALQPEISDAHCSSETPARPVSCRLAEKAAQD